MLTAPNEQNRPLYAAKDIKDFYLEHCPKTFPQPRQMLCPFNIKKLQPAIFSTYEVGHRPSVALLSDICISTSATPTYLPAHYFETKESTGKETQFDLIDGTVDANNPTLVALGEITKQIMKGHHDYFSIKQMDYKFIIDFWLYH